MANDIIDIDVFQTVENVEITVEPNLTTVNITDVVIDTTKLAILNNLSDLNNISTARTNLGLGNVDNTSDVNKPVSTAQATAIALKQNTLGFTPENVANKENTTLDTSTTKYPTNNLVKIVTDLKANLASPTFTGSVVVPDATLSTQAVNKAQLDAVSLNSALVPLNEGGGVGYVINGRTSANYGNIGGSATDLSFSDAVSSVRGATGLYSFAEGFNTRASGAQSVALNVGTTASGVQSLATGNSTTASNQEATAMGGFATASGNRSMAVNSATTASGSASFSANESTEARSFVEATFGRLNTLVTPSSTTAWVSTDRLFGVGNGTTSPTVRSDALIILKNGLATLPSVTNALITAGGAKAIITKEYADANYSGGGGGSTNLSTTYAPTTVTVVSSSGADAEIKAVDGTDAGIVTVAQKSTWDGKQDAIGFTPYNATNPLNFQTVSQVQSIADAKVSDEVYNVSTWDGVANVAPSKNAIRDKFASVDATLDNKQPISAVLTATTASFTTGDETKLDGIATGANVGVVPNTAITASTKTKITYDAKGLVTAGADANLNDLSDVNINTPLTDQVLVYDGLGEFRNGSLLSSNISNFNSATRAQTEAELVAGTNITITPSGTGATRQLTIASSGGSTSGSGTYSETPTWSNTAPTTLLANNFEWIEQNKFVNLRISLSYNVAASNTSVRLPLPSGAPVPKSITGFTGASNIQTFGSGLMFIDIDALPASAGRSCFLRRNSANNGYEVVVQHSAAISLKNVIANITYISE